MKKEVKLDEAIGKTLTAVGFSEKYGMCSPQAVLVFGDGTFTTLGVAYSYPEDNGQIEESELYMPEFWDHELIRVGIATQEELDRMRAKRAAVAEADHKKHQKAQYEALKREFGEAR